MAAQFPKSARLLKPNDFRFPRFKRQQTRHFSWVINPNGKNRLGISVSKKVLKQAVARNRIKRLLREVFRCEMERLDQCDIHAIGRASLRDDWRKLDRDEVFKQMKDALRSSHKNED